MQEPPPEVRYLFLVAGDDRTVGLHGESYVRRLGEALYPGWEGLAGEVLNAGYKGDTASSLLARIDGPLNKYRPQRVILSVGANDLWWPWLSAWGPIWWARGLYRRMRYGFSPTVDLDRLAAAYRSLIDRAQEVAGAGVVICTVAPLGERLASPLNLQVARLNGIIKHVAVDRGAVVADVWQAFVEVLSLAPRQSGRLPRWQWSLALDRRLMERMQAQRLSQRRRLSLTVDGIHLNACGADLWAVTVLQALLEVESG